MVRAKHRRRPRPQQPRTRQARLRDQDRGRRRAVLHEDVPCTVAVLVGPEDFAAMRRYTSFGFADYGAYLHDVEDLLRALHSRGLHVRVAVFDPGGYAEFCEERGLDPDTAMSRARYAADAAGPGAAVPYGGEPLDELVRAVVHGAERRAVLDYAAHVLEIHPSGPAACERAGRDLRALLERAGPGEHHLVCSSSVHGTPLVAAVHTEARDGAARLPEEDAELFRTVLAAGAVTGGGGGTVLRSRAEPHGRETVRGWSLADGRLRPLSAAQVFDAYCTDHRTGEPVAPEPGVDYEAGYPLTDPSERP